MIALLIISHSAALARGVQELAQQMAPDVPILVAGGTDEDEIGTSFERIFSQMEAGLQHDGVLALMDLGSAVMTAETAIEMLNPEQQSRVRLSNAPLVEGAISAATVAAGGAPLQQVAAAAEEARAMEKVERVGAAAPDPTEEEERASERRVLALPNPAGLHARPAAQIVRALAPFDATVRVRNLSRQSSAVSASSMVALLGLSAARGMELELSASGPQANEALDELSAMIEAGFGEMEGNPTPAVTTQEGAEGEFGEDDGMRGSAASSGSAIGPAWRLDAALPEPDPTPDGTPDQEQQTLATALRAAAKALERLSAESGSEGDIFAAQALLLDDPELLARAIQRIRQDEVSAAAAWHATIQEEATTLEQSENPLIAERATDLVDVGQRVLRELLGEATLGEVPPGAVAVAETLTPSLVPLLAQAGVVGLAAARGGPTSHVAILARGLGLPAVLGLGERLNQVVAGQSVIVDGTAGLLIVEPSAEQRASYEAHAKAARQRLEAARAEAAAPAITPSGRRITVAANVSSVAEAEAALVNGAEGVGLLRTEFLFLERDDLPDEESQLDALRSIFAPLGERPIIVRTLDVGGDKEVPALGLSMARNGFLGERGLRYSLNHPELFRTQLRAILRAAVGHKVSLMFPMVTTVEEVRSAKALLKQAQVELDEAAVAWTAPEEIGIMVEVPAAALAASTFSAEVDFFSVGSNDLIQYTMAAERTNEAVADLYQPEHPALWLLLERLVAQAHEAGCWVGLCGELGGDPEFTERLVGTGLDELSMAPASIPLVKAAIRAT